MPVFNNTYFVRIFVETLPYLDRDSEELGVSIEELPYMEGILSYSKNKKKKKKKHASSVLEKIKNKVRNLPPSFFFLFS